MDIYYEIKTISFEDSKRNSIVINVSEDMQPIASFLNSDIQTGYRANWY